MLPVFVCAQARALSFAHNACEGGGDFVYFARVSLWGKLETAACRVIVRLGEKEYSVEGFWAVEIGR